VDTRHLYPESHKMDRSYLDAGRPLAEQRVRQAAWRLAQVLDADLGGVDPFRLPHRGPDGLAGLLREPLANHHRPPCFLCTAWRETPSSAAMSCHDQP
jgi:hypothetical protein